MCSWGIGVKVVGDAWGKKTVGVGVFAGGWERVVRAGNVRLASSVEGWLKTYREGNCRLHGCSCAWGVCWHVVGFVTGTCRSVEQ